MTDTRREDVARAIALVDSLVDPPMSGRYGKYADAVLAALPAPPVVDEDVIADVLSSHLGGDEWGLEVLTNLTTEIAARLRGADRG
jgi:hypothetical protein